MTAEIFLLIQKHKLQGRNGCWIEILVNILLEDTSHNKGGYEEALFCISSCGRTAKVQSLKYTDSALFYW